VINVLLILLNMVSAVKREAKSSCRGTAPALGVELMGPEDALLSGKEQELWQGEKPSSYLRPGRGPRRPRPSGARWSCTETRPSQKTQRQRRTCSRSSLFVLEPLNLRFQPQLQPGHRARVATAASVLLQAR